ncbi:MAG TPA: hypothetical protein VKW77_08030, partial [Acidimicrobiales bacterium]|nr:hypothetical protein [Acidimicrobiales bacterium]
PEAVGPNVRNRTHRIRARLEVPASADGRPPTEGVVLAHGSGLGGWALFLTDGRPAYAHNFVSLREDRIVAGRPLEAGLHEIGFRFERTGDHRGTGVLEVDGAEAGRLEIQPFTLTRFSLTGAGLTCGYGNGLPVSALYRDRGRFPFTGRILDASVEVDGDAWVDPAVEVADAVAAQ